jgi:small subunit ribosomal protein S5
MPDWSFNMSRYNDHQQVPSDFSEKIVQVNRVSKKTKGGNQIGFSVLVVVGDKKGKVGIAFGKGPDVLSSIKKGVKKARKQLISIPMKGTTIPFIIRRSHGAATVLLKPAPKGSGIIAGGAVRAVVEAAGIRDIVGKSLGSSNQANNVYATFKALTEIKRLVKVKNIKLVNENKEDKKVETV